MSTFPDYVEPTAQSAAVQYSYRFGITCADPACGSPMVVIADDVCMVGQRLGAFPVPEGWSVVNGRPYCPKHIVTVRTPDLTRERFTTLVVDSATVAIAHVVSVTTRCVTWAKDWTPERYMELGEQAKREELSRGSTVVSYKTIRYASETTYAQDWASICVCGKYDISFIRLVASA